MVDEVCFRYKLACMSAAACGALQMKILMHPTGDSPSHGRCHCGERESLFPIPLIESYENVLKLYYGKTWHDEKGVPLRVLRRVPAAAVLLPSASAGQSQTASASTGWAASSVLR